MMIKNLNKNVCKKYPVFRVREDLNYLYDGCWHRGFDYKEFLEIMTMRTAGVTYMHIDINIQNQKFHWKEWCDAGGSNLANKFHGVTDIDLRDLIDTCEEIIKLILNLNRKAEEEVVDSAPFITRVKKELSLGESILKDAREKIQWWTLQRYEFDSLKHCYDSINNDIKECKKILKDYNDMPKLKQRDYILDFNEYGYYRLTEKSGSVQKLSEEIGKNRE